MAPLSVWLGDLNSVPGLGQAAVGLACVVISALCGAAIGIEREKRDKPAGLRTLILIAVGSSVFTLVSLMVASTRQTADPGRIAAQILPGIGFLGAGAIIRSRGTVFGLTTAATIWTVAAIGVTIGAGYVAAGVVFTGLTLAVLTLVQRLQIFIHGPCAVSRVVLAYRSERGRTWPRLQSVLDEYAIADETLAHGARSDGEKTLSAPICTVHREHRSVLRALSELPEILEIDVQR